MPKDTRRSQAYETCRVGPKIGRSPACPRRPRRTGRRDPRAVGSKPGCRRRSREEESAATLRRRAHMRCEARRLEVYALRSQRALRPMILSSAFAFEDDHGDHALGPGLVVGIRGPDLAHLLEQPITLRTAVNHLRPGLELLGAALVRNLDLDLRVGLDVLEPAGVSWCPALRSNDDVAIAISAVDKRGADVVATPGPFGGHEQHVIAPHADSESFLLVELGDRLLVPAACSHM